jgi:hypothetical protein
MSQKRQSRSAKGVSGLSPKSDIKLFSRAAGSASCTPQRWITTGVGLGTRLERVTGIVSSAPPLLLIILWNDGIAKTVDDVIDLVDRAIEGLR